MTEWHGNSDLTLGEMKSIIATIFQQPAERIEDWMIVIKMPCDKCGRDYCGDGDLATVSSRQGEYESGVRLQDPAFDLHLMAKLIDALAEQWSIEREART